GEDPGNYDSITPRRAAARPSRHGEWTPDPASESTDEHAGEGSDAQSDDRPDDGNDPEQRSPRRHATPGEDDAASLPVRHAEAPRTNKPQRKDTRGGPKRSQGQGKNKGPRKGPNKVQGQNARQGPQGKGAGQNKAANKGAGQNKAANKGAGQNKAANKGKGPNRNKGLKHGQDGPNNGQRRAKQRDDAEPANGADDGTESATVAPRKSGPATAPQDGHGPIPEFSTRAELKRYLRENGLLETADDEPETANDERAEESGAGEHSAASGQTAVAPTEPADEQDDDIDDGGSSIPS